MTTAVPSQSRVPRILAQQRLDNSASRVHPVANQVVSELLFGEAFDSTGSETLLRVKKLSEHAYGYRRDRGNRITRNAPSAGALYPTELIWMVHVRNAWHALHYDFRGHRFRTTNVTNAAAVADELGLTTNDAAVVLSSIAWRTVQRYGFRGYRYCQLDVGHVASNLQLVVGALGASGSTSVPPVVLTNLSHENLTLAHGELPLAAVVLSAQALDVLDSLDMPPLITDFPVSGQAEQPPWFSPALDRVIRLHAETQRSRELLALPAGLTKRPSIADALTTLQRRTSARGFGSGHVGDSDVSRLVAAIHDTVTAMPNRLRGSFAAAISSNRASSLEPVLVTRDIVLGSNLGALSHDELAAAFGHQPLASHADLFIVLGLNTGTLASCSAATYRAVLLLSGMVGARMSHEAADAGIAHTTIGGFSDEAVRTFTGDTVEPLVVHAFGPPSTTDVKNDADSTRWLTGLAAPVANDKNG